MSSKGGGKTQTVTQDNSPWAAQQPFLQSLFSRAEGLYGQPTVAAQSPFTQQAIQGLGSNALDPNSVVNKSAAEFGKTIGGDYLRPDSNPFLKGAVDDAMNQVQSRVAGTFGTRGGNNYGSSAHQEWLGRSLSDAAMPIYAQNYQTERGRQLNAAQMGPQMGAAPFQQLGQAGAMQDQYQQRLTDSPWEALQRYQGVVAGNYGGSSTSQQPLHGGNPLTDALGLGIGGVGLWNMMGGAPLLAASDRRLKRDIERIGTHPVGVPLYSYRYFYDDTPRIGVMADELEAVMPEAVRTDQRGFQMVDYSMLER